MLPEVKDRRRQHSIRTPFRDTIDQMLKFANAA